jgi:glycosyltransferase involved in cell wall biosynthesis
MGRQGVATYSRYFAAPMMEKIGIVSNYYPPEKGAAANRIEQLALKLQQNGYDVSVICPLANYPKGELFPGYKGKFSVNETLRGVKVKRLWIFPSNSKNILKRILSILSFSIGLFFHLLFARLPQKVVVQSPPLLLSFIAVSVLRWRRRKIILNVSDLWPSAAVELGVLKPDSMSHKMLLLVEKSLYKKATLVLGQSNEILQHVKEIIPAKNTFLYRNFPEHEPGFTANDSGKSIKLFYAGLLGVAQGVLGACDKMQLAGLNIEFHIFGDGAEKARIESYITAHPEKNITFHGMLERQHLHALLETFDIAFVPLTTRIYGSVPSKIFEYSALGLPLLYFGGGEGGNVVRENNLGWVAEVGDFKDLNTKLNEISALDKSQISVMKKRVFETAGREFDLDAQMTSLIAKGVF